MTILSSLFSSCFPWTAQNARGKHFQRRKIFGRKCELSLFFFFPCLFRAAPGAYGGSQARDRIRPAIANLLPSHSHPGSLTQ